MGSEEEVADFLPTRDVSDRGDIPISLYDTFQKQEPYYIALGMTHEEYWHGDNDLKRVMREAKRIRDKRQNEILWLQGKYVYDAFCAVMPFFSKHGKIEPYIKEPYDIFPPTAEEKEAKEKAIAEKGKGLLMAWMQGNKNSNEKEVK